MATTTTTTTSTGAGAAAADAKSDPNCVEPACKSKVDMFRSFMGGKGAAKQPQEAANPSAASTAPTTTPADCPLGREELGNATWGLLHSMGAYFPDKPSKEHQEKTRVFVEALALMYPCVHCAEDFQAEVKKSPPRVDSRASFSEWLCEQHNIVNTKIGKPRFPCTLQKLDERWRTGRPACWGEDADADAVPASLGQDE